MYRPKVSIFSRGDAHPQYSVTFENTRITRLEETSGKHWGKTKIHTRWKTREGIRYMSHIIGQD